ncbi:MAG: hypothetical protein ACI936_000842 [Paraglaciecola sp.]|jgi:hypothetical protein
MTNYNDESTCRHDTASNMETLKTAIFNGEEQRLKALLTNMLFDEIQKSYLISLAVHHGNLKIVRLFRSAPATP